MRLRQGEPPRNADDEKFNEIVYGQLGLCGCGIANETLDMVQEYLSYKKWWHDKSESWFCDDTYIEKFVEKYGEELFYFMAYIIDDREFTEHGTSINGAWNTDKGNEFLEMLLREDEVKGENI